MAIGHRMNMQAVTNRQWVLGGLMTLALLCCATARQVEARSRVAVIQDYETGGLPGTGYLTPETFEFSTDTPYGSRCLHVTITNSTWPRETYSIHSLGATYWPPEADMVRLRIKILNGQLVLAVGGPTMYCGNSDAMAGYVTLTKGAVPEWVTVDLPYYAPLVRNHRRASYSATAPLIAYTRWAQEPPQLTMFKGSSGDFLVDRIELYASGLSKPFPQFATQDVTHVKTLADFEQDISNACTLYMSEYQTNDFALSWLSTTPLAREPAVLTRVNDGEAGGHSLSARGKFYEEMSWVGIKARGTSGANAISFTVKAHGGQKSTVYGSSENYPLDFFILVAPTNEPFDWDRFGPTPEMLAGPDIGYSYNLSYVTIRALTDLDYAHYHARRYVAKDVWRTVVIPFADFHCAYGIGAYTNRFQTDMGLTGEDIFAVAFLAPWPRSSAAECTVLVDRVSLVSVPGSPGEHRSFWQPPSVQSMRLVNDPTYVSYGGLKHMLANDTNAPSVPQELSVQSAGTDRLSLSWLPSADDGSVAGYDILRDGADAGTAFTTNFTDTGLSPATVYTYAITAFDHMGNRSAESVTNSAMTLPEPAAMLALGTAAVYGMRRR
ncbi:fibronectin type III domain-containing protein [bacterium]|nr:fibronectin type III domain-containing protein [bacterium]